MSNTRDRLLTLLKSSQGEWISGEKLSDSLSISRTAISKHIKQLRKIGCRIDSAPKKGYFYTAGPDQLLPDDIRNGLKTYIFGQGKIVSLEETDSTNSVAKKLAIEGAEEGTIVLAENQTQGRGRKRRPWHSPPFCGLYLSIIVRPQLQPINAPGITLMTAVALTEALRSLSNAEILIKWPNDLLIKGKKLSGILTEISADMETIDYIVIGVGLNINTQIDDFPSDIKKIATSLSAEDGKLYSRIQVLQEFLKQFEIYYNQFRQEAFQEIIDRWKGFSNIIGQEVEVDINTEIQRGKVIDIDRNGVLILSDAATGKEVPIYSGDVTILNRSSN